MTNYDIVFFTLFRTDNPYSSISLSMAKELAKTQRVFYVNHPYSLKDLVRGLLRGDQTLRTRLPWLLSGRVRYEGLETIPKNFIAAQPPLTLPINWLPKGRLYNFFQRLNNGILLRSIRKVLRDHKVFNYLYINCYDPFYAGYLPKKMGAALCIYHCIDDIAQNAYTAKHGVDLENEAVRNADVTFVTSTKLKKLKETALRHPSPEGRGDADNSVEYSKALVAEHSTSPLPVGEGSGVGLNKRIVTFFNAADVSVFQKVISEKYPRPVELEGRTGKVVGFIGNLDELRIDYLLLKKIALAHPDKTLLLIGPVNSPEPKTIGLDKLPNVVFTGSRRLEELPPLLQHIDCALIPFLCNTLTESIYPLKINEYLAAGKPVVSTSFSDDIRSFADCIYLAENQEEFIRMIDEAIFENNAGLEQRRLEVANSNSWEARIRQFGQIVSDFEKKKIVAEAQRHEDAVKTNFVS
jgi:teichuronic acid biosynthesis glycosyltransferase TuaH